MSDLDQPDDLVADLAARLAAEGFPRVPAGVLMALTATESGAADSAELRARLHVSAAAVSGAVRYLVLLGFLRVVTVPGSRAHRYALTDTPWYTASLTRTDRYVVLADAIDTHAAELGPMALARLTETADFFRFLRDRMPALLDEWNDLRASGHG